MHSVNSDAQPGASNNPRRNGNSNSSSVFCADNNTIHANRRKSINYQPQIQFNLNANGGDEATLCSDATGRFSPHPNEIYLQQAVKLTIPPIEKIDDMVNCCLPPPSPAPNSDRFAADIQSTKNNTNQIQIQQQLSHFSPNGAPAYPLSSSNSSSSLCTNSGGSNQSPNALKSDSSSNKNSKYSFGCSSQRALSPNSRYRFDRYREPSQAAQKAKILENITTSSPTPSNSSSARFFLPPNNAMPLPLVQCDYGYLASTVHTPVKRYVPTPPPAIDLYADLGATAASASSSNNQSIAAQYVNTMPFSYRTKCCHSENQNQNVANGQSAEGNFNNKNFSLVNAASTCSSPGISAPATCSPVMATTTATSLCKARPNQSTMTMHNAVMAEQCPNSGRLKTPDDTESPITTGAGVGAGTCLHCNTARRTTGVHQTTQTTGPISPVPVVQQQLCDEKQNYCTAPPPNGLEHAAVVTLSPSTIESNLSPSSQIQQSKLTDSNMAFHHQQQPQQQHYTTQTMASTNSPSPRLQQPSQQQQSNSMHHLHVQSQPQSSMQQVLPQQQQSHRYSCKKRISIYMRREISRFFGVESTTEIEDFALWNGRHRRLAIRRFGVLDTNMEFNVPMNRDVIGGNRTNLELNASNPQIHQTYYAPDRPDILPAQDAKSADMVLHGQGKRRKYYPNNDFHSGDYVERKPSVAQMLMTSVSYFINIFNKRPLSYTIRRQGQWSRSFAPIHVRRADHGETDREMETEGGFVDGLTALIEEEVFFDNACETPSTSSGIVTNMENSQPNKQAASGSGSVGVYMGERLHGWRTSALNGVNSEILIADQSTRSVNVNVAQQQTHIHPGSIQAASIRTANSGRGTRITPQLLDGVLENSRRPPARRIKYFSANDLDDRSDHRPFFTYWINTVQIAVLFLSIVCYGIAPIGIGSEQKTGQVLVTSLSLQTVQHVEQRNLWIGPRNSDLVHMGAKFAACMRRDMKIVDVMTKTRRQERETACCIRNDDSGCVQSSQADCSIRGLYPTKSISTWKKWSPGESGPGGRISGSVCGLDPKFCDAPASIAPYEWPDDITKWPICRKTNSFSQRYRYKDHTAEHMVCEVIGHPCCTGVYGECRITTREYCDFVNGYFHEEASLCSQISCLNNVCGMFPFFSVEIPDQFYRLLTSLCMHAGVLHLGITLIFQHLFLADLERLIGPIRTAVVYIGSGLAGNLTSAVLVPHRPEVGPGASLCGVISSLVALLILMHWKHLHRPHVALFKLVLLCIVFFGIGTLPYQLNFAGLLAGVACGTFLTVSLVPFASFTKYGRRKKINLIWTCILFHVFVYSTLIATFYIFPSEFSTFNFGDVFGNSYGSPTNSNIGNSGGDVISSSSSRRFSQTQKPLYYYHHHSDDIIRNSAAFTQGTGISHILQHQQQQQQPEELQMQNSNQHWQEEIYSRSYIYHNNNHSDRSYKSNNANTVEFSKRKEIFSYLSQNNSSHLISKATAAKTNHKYVIDMNSTESIHV